jgi:transposase
MQHYVGLDVSVKETSVCIVDKAGKVIREVKVATKPAEILAVLTEEALAIERIGLEAGPLSQWLYSALAEAVLPVICVETRHIKAALSAHINKSDRNDARGIAQMMRVGLYRPVHVKTMASQKRRVLLTSRQLLQAKALDRERSAWHAAQFRPQGWHGGYGRVRGSNSRAGCGPSGLGRDRRTATDRPPGTARATRRASPPTA